MLVSRSVSSQARRKSTCAFGFVVSSIGTAALWMTPIFVVFEFFGPSSLTLPNSVGQLGRAGVRDDAVDGERAVGRPRDRGDEDR